MIFNKLPFIKFCFYILLVGLSYTLSSCTERSPGVVIVNLTGTWKWIKTYNANDKVIEESSPTLTKSLKIEDTNLDGRSVRVFRFYTNSIQTDSLFMYHGPGNPDINKHTLYTKTVDSEGNNALIRSTLYFQRKQYAPNKMIMNVQRDSDIYKASADTIQFEYLRDNL
jgi:hypothetical protein